MSTAAAGHRVEVAFAAGPAAVAAAIRDPARWWTPDVQRDGPVLTLRFGATWVRFALDADGLRWTCVAQDDPNLPERDEWVGTMLEFRLAPDPGSGTRLVFVHHGLGPHLECFDVCDLGWERFLHGSLKPLVEQGVGRPWS